MRNPWGDLPRPPLMHGIGNASLKITTHSLEAQSYFNQGLRLLHCFWYFEAYRAFRAAARIDPGAAMAYWGMAEAFMNFPTMAGAAESRLEQARSLAPNASAHEQAYIRAASDLADMPNGRAAYARDMQALIRDYPNDLNAPEFLAWFMMSGYDASGRPTPGELYAEALLRRILSSHPNDIAANHYWVHAVEAGPRPQDGLRSVALLLKLAPNSGHLVHMAGHIYYRLGDYDRARQSFLQSMRVDEAYMAREHIPSQYDANFSHNLSYLAAACAEAGRYQEALRWARKLARLPAPLTSGGSAIAYAVPTGSTLLRLHLRFADWHAAASDPVSFGGVRVSPGDAAMEYQDGWHAYAKGMAALHPNSGRPAVDEAKEDAAGLQSALSNLSRNYSAAPPADSFWVGGAIQLLETALAELQGSIEYDGNDEPGALRLLESAVGKENALGYTEPPYYARPVEETLGGVCLRAHAWELAREAFMQELRIRPRSGFALFGIARSYEFEGQSGNAAKAFEQFLVAWRHADPDLPQVKHAERWLAAYRAAHADRRFRTRSAAVAH
ncbi:MAG: hypothetical protein ACRD1N_00010 [Terriglobia bacterium]